VSKDFLNTARAWELDRTASVCPNCTQGCNTILETRDDMVVRMRPRSNAEVNQFYLCDHGRLQYRWMNRTDRVEAPLVRRGDRLAAADWDEALRAAALHLNGKRAFVLASPMLSTESLWTLARLVERTGGQGAFRVETGPEAPLPGVRDLALRAERAANVRAAELFGFTKSDTPLDGLRDGDVLVIADHGVTPAEASAVERAGAVIVVGTVLPDAARHAIAVLPSTNTAEEDGTFVNLRGRVQRYVQAKAAPGEAAFAALADARPEFAGMTYDALGLRGRPIAGAGEPAGAAR
jgi:NADH-quinone oxidoreductase subunit G